MRPHSLDITSSVSGNHAVFFGSKAFRRHIQAEQAIRVPRRRKIDWLMVFVWCVAMPFTAGWFWYAIYGLVKAAWGAI